MIHELHFKIFKSGSLIEQQLGGKTNQLISTGIAHYHFVWWNLWSLVLWEMGPSYSCPSTAWRKGGQLPPIQQLKLRRISIFTFVGIEALLPPFDMKMFAFFFFHFFKIFLVAQTERLIFKNRVNLRYPSR